MLTLDDPTHVPAALASAADFFGTDRFDVWVDSREWAAVLEPVLVSHRLHASDNTVVLALVGPLRARDGPSELDVSEIVDDEAV